MRLLAVMVIWYALIILKPKRLFNMKKHLLFTLGLILALSGSALAQTQNNVIGSTGPVGIDFSSSTGLTAPLTVNSPGTTYMVIGNPTLTGYTSMGFGLSAQTNGSGAIQVTKTAGSPSTYGNLNLNPYGGYTSIGTLTTSTLIAPLDVSGASAFGGSNGNICPSCYSLTQLNGTGKTLVGWNRSNGRGEMDFINERGGGSQGGFWFERWNDTTEVPLMYILGNGCVGIGMTTPTFSNTYKLSVDGSMVATAVVVKAYANWPDYVFTPKYKLPDLSNLQGYIRQNHHLPGMPTATDIKNNGLNLGEVENILTKKVEELTLYLIQKDEQLNKENLQLNQQKDLISLQQKEIDNLKAQVEAIKNAIALKKN